MLSEAKHLRLFFDVSALAVIQELLGRRGISTGEQHAMGIKNQRRNDGQDRQNIQYEDERADLGKEPRIEGTEEHRPIVLTACH
jgi:hypothetical protein